MTIEVIVLDVMESNVLGSPDINKHRRRREDKDATYRPINSFIRIAFTYNPNPNSNIATGETWVAPSHFAFFPRALPLPPDPFITTEIPSSISARSAEQRNSRPLEWPRRSGPRHRQRNYIIISPRIVRQIHVASRSRSRCDVSTSSAIFVFVPWITGNYLCAS